MFTLFGDLRFASRLLFSRPGFTAVAVLTLALGIGITTAMFSVLETMYWKSFPGVPKAHQLAQLETIAPDGTVVQSAWLDFRHFRDRLRPIAGVAAHDEKEFSLGLAEGARPLWGEVVSGNYFAVLGVKTAIGRTFSNQEQSDTAGASPVVVISHRLWVTEFEGTYSVLGRTVRVNRHNLTVIGVMPPEFRGAMFGGRSDLWVPFTMGAELGVIEKETFRDSTLRNLYMFARPNPGVKIDQLRAEAGAVAAQIAASEPVGHRGVTATVEPMWRSKAHDRDSILRTMLILMAVSLLVLLIVCANVANLLLVRSVGRLQEFGVRIALGAGRWRLARLLLTETMVFGFLSALLAIPLALWITDSARLLLPKMARSSAAPIGMDGRILAFAFGICAIAAMASSLAPVLFVVRSDINATLREGGRMGRAGTRSHRLRGLLVVSEVALAQVVLIGAGLFLRSYLNTSALDPGFERRGVLLASFPLASGGYSVDELKNFCLRLRERVEHTPGIEAVSYGDYAPLWSSDGPYTRVQPEGFLSTSPDEMKIHRTSVAPGYFNLMKIPMLEGRDFTEADVRTSHPVMIVDQTFARRFYGGASPIGRRALVWQEWRTIVGLVRDSKYFSITETSRPHYYLPFDQSYKQGQNLVFFVRTSGDPEASIATLRAAATAIDSNAAGFRAAPITDYNDMLLFPQKLAASLLGVLGIVAFLLAGVGLYGIMSYSVSQRTQELGIRIALGATAHELVAQVVRQGLVLTIAGVTVGLVLALGLMRVVATFLVGVSPLDPATFSSTTLFLVSVAALASFIPARRATQVDPFTALRAE